MRMVRRICCTQSHYHFDSTMILSVELLPGKCDQSQLERLGAQRRGLEEGEREPARRSDLDASTRCGGKSTRPTPITLILTHIHTMEQLRQQQAAAATQSPRRTMASSHVIDMTSDDAPTINSHDTSAPPPRLINVPQRKHAKPTMIQVLDDDPPALPPRATASAASSSTSSTATSTDAATPAATHPHIAAARNMLGKAGAALEDFTHAMLKQQPLSEISDRIFQQYQQHPNTTAAGPHKLGTGRPPPTTASNVQRSIHQPYRPPTMGYPGAAYSIGTGGPKLPGDPLADEPEPLGNSGATIDAKDRDRQLQEMLSNVVDLSELDDSRVDLPGMTCTLMPHQRQGVQWMINREKGKDKGGILADDMGLGKTIQTLALIVCNRPSIENASIRYIEEAPPTKAGSSKKKTAEDSPEQPKRREIELKSKTTLIVAPLAVIRQWEQEIETKSDAKLKVLVHHGNDRARSANVLEKFDVVITTYSTAAAEWGNTPAGEAWAAKKGKGNKKGKGKAAAESAADDDSDDASDTDQLDSGEDSSVGPGRKPAAKAKVAPPAKKKAPPPTPLFDARWLRVVLDEAQNIKNHNAKCSLASFDLSKRSHSKWCLSGTPIQNSCIELYSLIHFLDIPPFNEYKHFQEKIGKPLQSTNQNRVNWGLKRLRIVLGAIMLRRTKDSEGADGKKILTLPKREVEVVWTDFEDPAERAFYSSLETKMQSALKADGQTGKINHMGALVMLLRLRQACSHPALTMKNIVLDAAPTPAPAAGSSIQKSSPLGDADDADDLANALSALTVNHTCDMCRSPLDPGATAAGGSTTRCAECTEAVEKSQQSGHEWLSPGRGSTKVRLMVNQLKKFNQEAHEEKTIVFSQFTGFLDLVEPFLKEEKLNFVRCESQSLARWPRLRCADKLPIDR